MPLQISIVNRFLRFTPEGRRIIIISLAIGFAAVNTGNNLLYLVLAMLLSIIITSGILSEWNIKGVTIKRSFPPYIFAQSPCGVLAHVTNNKKYLPSFSLELEEEVDGKKHAKLIYVFYIRPRTTLTLRYFFTFSSRGIHRVKTPHLTTRFPFGFFVKGQRSREIQEILAYPKIMPKEDLPYFQGGLDEEGIFPTSRKGRGQEIYTIRDYIPGDTARDIHWRSTAKRIRPMVKEYERPGIKKKIQIVLDISVTSEINEEAIKFERRVSEAASLAYHLLNEGEYLVGLTMGAKIIDPDRGSAHLQRILEELALVQPLPAVLKGMPPSPPDTEIILIGSGG